MRIGIDISQIVHEGTGVSRFTEGLTNAILDFDEKNQWLFFFSSLRKNLDQNLENKILSKGHKLIKWKIPPTILSFLFNNLHGFSKLLAFNFSLLTSLDCFITSDWTEPFLPGIKKSTVVHDLTYLRYPETVNKTILQTQKKRLNWVRRESDIIFADSQTTKKDLIELLNIEESRIVVNYPGVEVLKPSKDQVNKTLAKYDLKDRKFVLTVGKLEPRKNFDRLIKGFNQINNSAIQLVIVGPQGWDIKNGDTPMNRLIGVNNQNVLYLGYLTDKELYSLYASCLFFIFPSIWEGFGYPIIEAMKLGAPIACSNTSSIKEIAGDAALFFDPLDTNCMYQSIDRLIQDQNLRKQLIQKGFQRSGIFSWRNYYDKMIQTLMSC